LAHCPSDDDIKPQKSKTYPLSDNTHQNSQTQVSKSFFSDQTTTILESFEGANSSLACSRGKVSRVIECRTSRQWETHADFGFLWTTEFWGHNFGSRHSKRSIKGSIDADDHVVFTKCLR